jgi:spore germination protein YaaH
MIRTWIVAGLLLLPNALSGQISVHKAFADLYADHALEKADAIGSSSYVLQPRNLAVQSSPLKREVFGYLPYWFRSRWGQLDYSLVSTIAYFSGEVSSDGSVGNTNGWPKYPGDPAAAADVINMINAAHAKGVRVVLCFTNFDGAQIQAIVSTPSACEAFIQQSLAIVKAGNADGININFEGILSTSRDYLTQFMIALADSFHTLLPGSQVSCAPTDFDTRQGDWDLVALNPALDLFFFQGYGYHYAGGAASGPVGLLPNTSFWGSTNISTLINVVLSKIPTDKVLLGLPHFGYRWPTTGPDANSLTSGTGVAFYYPDALGYISTYGRQWDALALNPWYRYQVGPQWYQGWYDDPESMSYKYQFAILRNLKGIGMWSLGMDGPNHDIWDMLARYFADTTALHLAPKAPILSVVRDSLDQSGHSLFARWVMNRESYLGGYRLYCSTDPAMLNGMPLLDETTVGKTDTTALITGLQPGSTYFFRMVAVDTSGTMPSDTSDTYAVRLGSGNRYLVVDGFDRITGSWSFSKHSFASSYGKSIAAAGRYFDVADNDALILGTVSLDGYSGVIWFLGDESTADRTFTVTEQAKLSAYLDKGGRVFVTGSEIGYDLGRTGSPNYSPSFYTSYFKVTYAGDKAASTSFTGSSGTVFEGISGQCGIVYPEDYPDYVTLAGGSVACATYAGGQIAAVQYSGNFGTGLVPGKLIYIGFTFETIGSEAVRDGLISRALDFFEGVSSAPASNLLPERVMLFQNYPNPFNPSTVIKYTIAGVKDQGQGFIDVRIVVYDLLGREVTVLVNDRQAPGSYSVQFGGVDLAGGMYLIRLQTGGVTQTIKALLLK